MMERFSKYFGIIYTLSKLLENCILNPIKRVWQFIAPVRNWYNRKWKEYCYDKYDDFLWKKAARMIGLTLLSIYAAICFVEFTLDLGYYLLTKKEETIYLSDSVELENDLWGVKGCPTKACSSDNALYFRIKNTWFNNIWNIFHNGQVFFPDGIASGVLTGQSKCRVISYGLRYRLVMVLNYYPQILEVECIDARDEPVE